MKPLRCVLIVACVCLLTAWSEARAQTSVYASVDETQYGFASGNSGTFAYAPGSDTYSFYKVGVGFEGGATYLFPSSSRLKGGIDVRGMYSPGARGGAGGMAALRIAFVPRTHAVSEYFQLGGGILSTTVLNPSTNVSNERIHSGAIEFDFGLNVRVSSRFAVRALELGGYAGSNVTLSSFGAGLIYNLPSHKDSNP